MARSAGRFGETIGAQLRSGRTGGGASWFVLRPTWEPL